jgi:tetratricopeptide (TPR) repeat protein
LKNPHRQALLLTVLGTVRFLQKADDADEYHQKAEKIAQENEDNFALCMILHNRGYQALNRTEPDYQLGCQLSNQAAQIAEGLGLAQLHFFSLLNRGSGELELGQHEQALATHQEALKLAETESNHQWIANILHSIGEDHDALGHRDEAQTAFTKALELYRQIGATSNANDLVELMREKNYQVN